MIKEYEIAKNNIREIIGKYFLIFSLISFIGWLWETLYLKVVTGNFYDRGFMTLPFCPIYGLVIAMIYFSIGTPRKGRGVLKSISNDSARIPMYILLSFLFPTIAELVTGAFFTEVLNISLWSYTDMPYNTYGYIALPVSVIWAIAIVAFMYFIFPLIKKAVFKMPKIISNYLSLILLIITSADFLINLVDAIKKI